MPKSTKQLVKGHIKLLRRHSPNPNFRSIYDYDIYNNIFFEDIALYCAKTKKGSKVLDFGCGRGTSSYVLSKKGLDVVGIDVSYQDLDDALTSYVMPEDIQKPLWDKTKKALKNKNLDFKFYDGNKLPFKKNTFDSIFAYAVLEHVEDINATLKELNRVLKKGGTLFVSRTPNKYSVLENLAHFLGIPAHDSMFSKGELRKIIEKNGFKVDSIKLIDFFPSNLPNKKVNNIYQKQHKIAMYLEKIIRYTPVNLISHHFRVFAEKI